MTEEEKKAIEYLKNRLEILHNNTQWATENSIKVVLNLIDKQQEEIKALELIHKTYKEEIKSIEDRYISKDKIREYYHKICASVNHFKSKNDNNIVLRIKKYLEKLIED